LGVSMVSLLFLGPTKTKRAGWTTGPILSKIGFSPVTELESVVGLAGRQCSEH
jgi:hypothetical protein